MTKLSKLIADRLHPEDIALILGRHPVAVRRLLPKDYRPKPRAETIPGLTQASVKLRAALGSIVVSMTESGLSRSEIGELTGLNARESIRAETRPFNHNWTLSQIERTVQYAKSKNPRFDFLDCDAEDEA